MTITVGDIMHEIDLFVIRLGIQIKNSTDDAERRGLYQSRLAVRAMRNVLRSTEFAEKVSTENSMKEVRRLLDD